MYKTPLMKPTGLQVNEGKEGNTLEGRIERMMNNKENIEGEAPLTFTERKEGVIPAYNIRTDRFEVAIEAMDKVARSNQARRAEKHAEPKPDEVTGSEPIQGTE